MTAMELRAQILQLVEEEQDTSVLEAIRTLLFKLKREQADDDFTEEELAELERRRARYLSGESKGFTVEESMRLLRDAQARDEGV